MKVRSRIAMVPCVAALAWCCAALAWAGDEPVSAAAKDKAPPDTTQAEKNLPAADEFVAVDETPKVAKSVPPKYPEAARKRREQGTVYVQALVSKKGKVLDTLIRSGKGVSPDLDKAANEAVRQWTFVPAKKEGKPVAVWVVVPVKFRLK